MPDNMKTNGMQTKQKIMIAVIVVILLIVLWQLKGLFSSDSTQIQPVPQPSATAKAGVAANGNMPANKPAASSLPPGGLKEAPLPSRDATMSEGEKRLLALQMQTEAKYIAAMNELQLLRVQSEIAKNSKDIAQNRLDAVTAQKQTLQLLSAPQATAATYAQGLSGNSTAAASPAGAPAQPAAPIAAAPARVDYVVVSVSQLQGKWTAVLGYQGQLYSVVVGDVLTADGSKVIGIDRYGVTLNQNGNKQHVSLVSLI